LLKQVLTAGAANLGQGVAIQGAGLVQPGAALKALKAESTRAPQVVLPGQTARFRFRVSNLGSSHEVVHYRVSVLASPRERPDPTVANPVRATPGQSVRSLLPGHSAEEDVAVTVAEDWPGMENALYRINLQASSGADPRAAGDETALLVVRATRRSMTESIRLAAIDLGQAGAEAGAVTRERLAAMVRQVEAARDHTAFKRWNDADRALVAALAAATDLEVLLQSGDSGLAGPAADQLLARLRDLRGQIHRCLAATP
jgi:hypothetical protein